MPAFVNELTPSELDALRRNVEFPDYEDGLRNGVPRNRSTRHGCPRWEGCACRVLRALERVVGLPARVARWRGVERELERRYL